MRWIVLGLVLMLAPAANAQGERLLVCGPDPKNPDSYDWMQRPISAGIQTAENDCLDIIAQTNSNDPEHIAALVNLGALRGRLYSDYDGEIRYESQALGLDPKNVAAYADRAFAEGYKGDVAPTLADATQALALHPSRDDAVQLYDLRARVYDESQRHDLAMAEYRSAIALYPYDMEATDALRKDASVRMGGVVVAVVGGVFAVFLLAIGIVFAIRSERRRQIASHR